MSLAVLFNYIPHIIRLSCLLEFPSGNKILDLPDGPDGVTVSLSQPVEESPAVCENGRNKKDSNMGHTI